MSNLYYNQKDGWFFEQDGEKILTNNIRFDPSFIDTVEMIHNMDAIEEISKVVFQELTILKNHLLCPFKFNFTSDDIRNIVLRIKEEYDNQSCV